ncbi:MAG: ABC transporter ATP-binding protein [Burkholderiales bacterium]|nr:ABC transporter ATP-binding protein [Burkholderiales bacterium]
MVVLAGVTRTFMPGRPLFTDLNLCIRAGERVALRGESGVGKSTLLNLIAGLDVPDSGTVSVGGRRIDTLSADERARFRRDSLGFVFQAFHLLPHLSAVQNAMLPLLLKGQGEARAQAAAGDLLTQLGLAARMYAYPGELSGGEQQRVALARALVHGPQLVLADEPTGNLDPATARTALAALIDTCTSRGAALLMVTHSAEAAAVADRRLVLSAQGLAEST